MKENKTIEFKKNWQDDYLKVVAAFANSDGGEIYIGVDDQGNPISLRNTKRLLEELPNKILGKLGIIASVDTTELNGKITNKEYQEINNCFRNTASNDLNILVSKDILKPTGKRGKGSYYVIAH